MTKYIRVRLPVPPTKEIMTAMAEATFLSDRSDLEMERRYNGLLAALGYDQAGRKLKT